MSERKPTHRRALPMRDGKTATPVPVVTFFSPRAGTMPTGHAHPETTPLTLLTTASVYPRHERRSARFSLCDRRRRNIAIRHRDAGGGHSVQAAKAAADSLGFAPAAEHFAPAATSQQARRKLLTRLDLNRDSFSKHIATME